MYTCVVNFMYVCVCVCVCASGDQADTSGGDEDGDAQRPRHEARLSDHLHLQIIPTGGQVLYICMHYYIHSIFSKQVL